MRNVLASVVLGMAIVASVEAAPEAVTVSAPVAAKLPVGSHLRGAPHGPDGDGFWRVEGGIDLPTAGVLGPASGGVRASFRLPSAWPPDTDQTLFHVGDETHVHLTVFFRKGSLVAVYKGGEEHYASVQDRSSSGWAPSSLHTVEFGWDSRGTAVDAVLRVDDRLVGLTRGHLIKRWPERCYIGTRGGRSGWQGDLQRVDLFASMPEFPEFAPGDWSVEVDAARRVGSAYPFWTIVNFTSEHMFADPAERERIRWRHPFIEQVNCVRLMGGRHDGRNAYFKGIRENGELDCDFTDLVAYLRGMLEMGLTPRIVLDNVPTAMSEPGELSTYGNTRPPQDEKVWHRYVQLAVQAMVDAFGKERVRAWRFRVGTEPDLYPGHWQGTKEEYLLHYDATVDAVLSVIPEADIGPGNILNPAGHDANADSERRHWGLDIIDHAATGRNLWTGKQGTVLRHFSCSWYGRVGRPLDSFSVAVQRMRERLDRYPALRDVPVSVAEFSILQDEAGRRVSSGEMTEWGASWYAAIADRVYSLGVEQVHEWSQTTAGLPHPRTNVIWMLSQMAGGERLGVTANDASSAACGAVAVAKEDAIYVMLYNHRASRSPEVAERVALSVRDTRFRAGEAWALDEWRIDRTHGVFAHALYEDCEKAGLGPLPNSPLYGGNPALRFGKGVHALIHANRERYAELAKVPQVQTKAPVEVADGVWRQDVVLPGHSVRLLRLARMAGR